MDKRQIENISANTEEAIKRKTAYGLPDRPSESGMRADEIKKAFYAAITDKNDSLLAEIKRIVNESNDVVADIYSLIEAQKKVDISQGSANANKIMVTDDNGNIITSKIIPVGVCKLYTEADLDTGEYSFVFEFPDEEVVSE